MRLWGCHSFAGQEPQQVSLSRHWRGEARLQLGTTVAQLQALPLPAPALQHQRWHGTTPVGGITLLKENYVAGLFIMLPSKCSHEI